MILWIYFGRSLYDLWHDSRFVPIDSCNMKCLLIKLAKWFILLMCRMMICFLLRVSKLLWYACLSKFVLFWWFQQVGICDIQTKGDGKDIRERHLSDMQNIWSAGHWKLWKDHVGWPYAQPPTITRLTNLFFLMMMISENGQGDLARWDGAGVGLGELYIKKARYEDPLFLAIILSLLLPLCCIECVSMELLRKIQVLWFEELFLPFFCSKYNESGTTIHRYY